MSTRSAATNEVVRENVDEEKKQAFLFVSEEEIGEAVEEQQPKSDQLGEAESKIIFTGDFITQKEEEEEGEEEEEEEEERFKERAEEALRNIISSFESAAGGDVSSDDGTGNSKKEKEVERNSGFEEEEEDKKEKEKEAAVSVNTNNGQEDDDRIGPGDTYNSEKHTPTSAVDRSGGSSSNPVNKKEGGNTHGNKIVNNDNNDDDGNNKKSVPHHSSPPRPPPASAVYVGLERLKEQFPSPLFLHSSSSPSPSPSSYRRPTTPSNVLLPVHGTVSDDGGDGAHGIDGDEGRNAHLFFGKGRGSARRAIANLPENVNSEGSGVSGRGRRVGGVGTEAEEDRQGQGSRRGRAPPSPPLPIITPPTNRYPSSSSSSKTTRAQFDQQYDNDNGDANDGDGDAANDRMTRGRNQSSLSSRLGSVGSVYHQHQHHHHDPPLLHSAHSSSSSSSMGPPFPNKKGLTERIVEASFHTYQKSSSSSFFGSRAVVGAAAAATNGVDNTRLGNRNVNKAVSLDAAAAAADSAEEDYLLRVSAESHLHRPTPTVAPRVVDLTGWGGGSEGGVKRGQPLSEGGGGPTKKEEWMRRGGGSSRHLNKVFRHVHPIISSDPTSFIIMGDNKGKCIDSSGNGKGVGVGSFSFPQHGGEGDGSPQELVVDISAFGSVFHHDRLISRSKKDVDGQGSAIHGINGALGGYRGEEEHSSSLLLGKAIARHYYAQLVGFYEFIFLYPHPHRDHHHPLDPHSSLRATVEDHPTRNTTKERSGSFNQRVESIPQILLHYGLAPTPPSISSSSNSSSSSWQSYVEYLYSAVPRYHFEKFLFHLRPPSNSPTLPLRSNNNSLSAANTLERGARQWQQGPFLGGQHTFAEQQQNNISSLLLSYSSSPAAAVSPMVAAARDRADVLFASLREKYLLMAMSNNNTSNGYGGGGGGLTVDANAFPFIHFVS